MLGIPHEIGAAVEAHPHPLVGIHYDGIRGLDALPHPAALGQDHGRARQGRVHVEPEAVCRSEAGNALHIVQGGGGSGAYGGHHRAGDAARGQIRLDGSFQQVQSQGVVLVSIDEVQVLPAKTRQEGGLGNRAVGLAGGVDDERLLFPLQPAPGLSKGCAALPRAEQGAEGGRRSRILDDAGEGLRQPQHLAQPVHHHLFHFRGRRTGLPAHALGTETGAGEIAQYGGQIGIAGKIGEEARVVPVGDARQHDLFEILEDVLQPFALEGWFRGQLASDVPGLHRAHHRQGFHAFPVGRDPFDEVVASAAEGVGVHGQGFLSGASRCWPGVEDTPGAGWLV